MASSQLSQWLERFRFTFGSDLHEAGEVHGVVVDVVPESGTPSYEQKRALLESLVATDAVFSGDTSRVVPCGAVVLTPPIRADSHVEALAYYQRLREANRALGCAFFEGVVMKRADSLYPVQVRSGTEEFRGWVKHRFLS